jgi:hypothetical protein
LSAVQLPAPLQTPLAVSHCRLQQSVATAHELPDPLQVVTEEAQVCDTGSHDLEQHCALDVQAAAANAQTTFVPPVPGAPACPPPPVPPVPVLSVLTELFPQPGSASSAATSKAATAAIEIVVGEGFIPG